MIKVMEGGKTAYLGLGFSDRADSFDVNTTLHDHFKGIKVKRVCLTVTSLLFPGPLLMGSTHSVPVPVPACPLETLCVCI